MKTAKEYWYERFGEYPQNDAEKLAVAMMAEFAAQDKWISVDIRFPENKQYVLCFAVGGRMFTALHNKGKFAAYNPFNDSIEECELVTHWKQLQPPKSN